MTEGSERAEPSNDALERDIQPGAHVLELDKGTTPGQPQSSEAESHEEGQHSHQKRQAQHWPQHPQQEQEQEQEQEQQARPPQHQQQQQQQHPPKLPRRVHDLSPLTTTPATTSSNPPPLFQQIHHPHVNKTSLGHDVTQTQASAGAGASANPSPTTSTSASSNLSPITPTDADHPHRPALPFVAPSHYLRRPRSIGDVHTQRRDSPTSERPRSSLSGSVGSIAEEREPSIRQEVKDDQQQHASRDRERGREQQGDSGQGKDNRGSTIGWRLRRAQDAGRGRAAARKMSPMDSEQHEGLRIIRAFLKVRTSYDVLPLSFRLIVFDTALLVKKSLNILIQNGIVSAPLWDSKTSTFAGLLTVSDYINVIQYYVQNPDSLSTIDQFRLNSLREIEKAIGVQPLETISAHPMQPLYTACRRMLESRARRIPLVDVDDETNRSMVVSVVTQYRILKFVAVNVKETQMLRKRLGEIRCVTTEGLQTAKMETGVMDVIQIFVKYSISSVPILDDDGCLVNVFEAVDVIALIKGGVYDDLNLTVGEALLKRSDDFPGIFTCTLNDRLDSIFDTIRKSRVHRFVVIDEEKKLSGLLTLSDILEYILLEGVDEDES